MWRYKMVTFKNFIQIYYLGEHTAKWWLLYANYYLLVYCMGDIFLFHLFIIHEIFKFNVIIHSFHYFVNQIVPIWAVWTLSSWHLVLWHPPTDFEHFLFFGKMEFLVSSCTCSAPAWSFRQGTPIPYFN